jgi:hypothetical protein
VAEASPPPSRNQETGDRGSFITATYQTIYATPNFPNAISNILGDAAAFIRLRWKLLGKIISRGTENIFSFS